MPCYEYQCSRCGHHHEALQKITDTPLRKCPECGRAALTRLMSAPIFRLKGGGWYETDFKSEKDAKRNLAGEKEAADGKADSAAGGQKEGKQEGKQDDAKPAAGTRLEAKPAAATGEPAADKARGSKPAAAASGAKRGMARRVRRGRR